MVWKCWRARISVGAINDTLRARLDGIEQRQEGDDRLAAADVALQQAQHARLPGHVGEDVAHGRLLRAGEGKGEGCQRLRAQAAIALERTAGEPALMRAHQCHRELVGEKLVIGEARAGLGRVIEVGLALRRMGLHERGVPVRPTLARAVGGVDPLGQLRRAYERGAHGLPHHLEGEPRRERIDRLDSLEAFELCERADVVRVRDLQAVAEALEPAAHHALSTHRQHLLEIVGARVEENEEKKAGLVAAAHAIGETRIAGWLMAIDPKGERRDLALLRIADLGRIAPVDQSARQVPEQPHDASAGQALVKLLKPRADTGERGHGCKQGIEDLRAHLVWALCSRGC